MNETEILNCVGLEGISKGRENLLWFPMLNEQVQASVHKTPSQVSQAFYEKLGSQGCHINDGGK